MEGNSCEDAVTGRLKRGQKMDRADSPLLTDLYQLTMMQAYLDHGKTGIAVFEFFMRKLPANRRFLLAAGLEQALGFLENLRFPPDDLEALRASGRFSSSLIDYLAEFRFTGDVHAMPEGNVFFPEEPILRVTAPLPEAQLVETRLINILHFQTLIASKAARHVLLAPGKILADFGLRRAHGAEAGFLAARASYIAGYSGTATVLAGLRFGIPLYGTMAHSFIESFDDEAEAFEAFARSRPEGLTLLIDTYDAETAARKIVPLARKLKRDGISIRAVRIDSGGLISLSRSVRRILDEGGFPEIAIFASGGLDDGDLIDFARANAPIDGFGIGTSLTTSSDRPALECAYKLQEYDGTPRRKYSPGKETWPGRKQVWRSFDADGRMAGDVLGLESERHDGVPLIIPVMTGGRRVSVSPTLAGIRERAALSLAALPGRLRSLDPDADYRVDISAPLRAFAAEADRRLAKGRGA